MFSQGAGDKGDDIKNPTEHFMTIGEGLQYGGSNKNFLEPKRNLLVNERNYTNFGVGCTTYHHEYTLNRYAKAIRHITLAQKEHSRTAGYCHNGLRQPLEHDTHRVLQHIYAQKAHAYNGLDQTSMCKIVFGLFQNMYNLTRFKIPLPIHAAFAEAAQLVSEAHGKTATVLATAEKAGQTSAIVTSLHSVPNRAVARAYHELNQRKKARAAAADSTKIVKYSSCPVVKRPL